MFPFKKILCPTDFSEPSLCTLKMANKVVGELPAEIILVNVHKPIPHLPTPRIEASETVFDISAYEQQIIEEARENLDKVRREHLADGTPAKLVVRIGRPAEEILKVAEEEDVDVIFIATHGRSGLAKFMFGSVAQRVVRRAACPVMSIRMCK